MLTSIYIFYALFIATITVAIRWGAEPERYGAYLYLGLLGFQASSYLILPPKFVSVDGISLTTDLIALIGFGWIGLSAKRLWPLLIAALQLISVAGHFARWIQYEIEPYVYSLLRTSPTAVSLLVLLCGVWLHQKRLKVRGHDPSWVDWQKAANFR